MPKPSIVKYGHTWYDRTGTPEDLAEIEMTMIQRGGRYQDDKRHWHGLGLLHHYLALRKLIWPERYEHRWTRLIYENIIENQITVMMGAASTGKTSTASEWILLDYWCFPENTCCLVSTVTREKLEQAVFGEIKMLWQMGRERFPWLAGNLLDHAKAITTDNILEDGIRDMRKGIVGRACYVGQRWVGLGSFAGTKQERFRFLGDEAQFCAPTLLECIPNMLSNTGAGGLKVVFSGNPRHDPEDPLGIIGEPIDGWASVEGVTKTTVWSTKMRNSKCVNLIGMDSPNLDTPEGQPEPYPKLIGREFIKTIAHNYGKDSPEMETQVWGRMKIGLAQMRVITRQLCREHKAHDPVVWLGTARTRIYALDPAYGGGDRCVGGMVEFGKDVDGKIVLFIHPPKVISLNAGEPRDIEDQIVDRVYEDLSSMNIDSNNCFYDSFGKGTLGFAFARKFGVNPPIPIDSSARCSQRPVRDDLYIKDDKRRERRLKLCSEHYSKFVTEMWFSVRYTIEAEQLRNLPEDVMKEGCSRVYYTVPGQMGDRIEVEPKDDMKERIGRSPDLFDWCFLENTMVATPNGSVPIQKLKTGDSVITPFGTTQVNELRTRSAQWVTDVRFSNGSTLSGLGDHKVFTWDRGWTRLDRLSIANESESIYTLPIWQLLNLLFTKDTSTSFKALVDIIRTAGTMRRRDFFIDAFGLTTVVLFLKACACITKTAIGRTTTFITSNLFRVQNTLRTTCEKGGLIQNIALASYGYGRLVESLLRRCGIGLRLVRNGTARTPGISGRYAKRNPPFARSAGTPSSSTFQRGEKTIFVPPDAVIDHSEERHIVFREFVMCAARALWRSSIGRRKVVPVTVRRSLLHESRKVYNLTLNDHNVYYANGILVQNCALAIEGARQRGFRIAKLANTESESNTLQWLSDLRDKQKSFTKEWQLNAA